MPTIVLLPGDGIGPEIMAAATQILAELGEFEFDERLVGGASIDAHGTALRPERWPGSNRLQTVDAPTTVAIK
jgi:3-isopropylmalate dehydrogenase